MEQPKILLWDIETGYNLLKTFSLFNDYISYKLIQEERYIICGSFRELGTKRVHTISILDDPKRFKKNPRDDYYVVKALREVLCGYDAVIAQNGDRFDTPYLNTRCIYHGLKPMPPVIQIDTLKMAKSKFKFNSNRLDYLGKFLGCGNKIKTDEELWLGCFEGKKSYIKEMIAYNKEDVNLLERVYYKLAPYCATKINMNLFTEDDVCPNCGSHNLRKEGTKRTMTRTYQQFVCKDCGKWSSSTIAEKSGRARIK